MKPLRPAWITVLVIIIFLGLTVAGWIANGIFGLIPLAFAFAFTYDLSHHSTSRRAVIIIRVFAILGILAAVVAALYFKALAGAGF
jgi:hypothetical protein